VPYDAFLFFLFLFKITIVNEVAIAKTAIPIVYPIGHVPPLLGETAVPTGAMSANT
jgi:hypothetical protein